MEWAAAILRAVCRAIFATYSLQAFLNKKQGISPLDANLVQTSPPQRHGFNESFMRVYNFALKAGVSTSVLAAKVLELDRGEVRLLGLLLDF
ncbi:MAG TPA: hypothetical protein VNY07_11070 [Chthoniobacterales bacterium]|nr:hypothetical protein [Chthoniobacterales bacterium]